MLNAWQGIGIGIVMEPLLQRMILWFGTIFCPLNFIIYNVLHFPPIQQAEAEPLFISKQKISQETFDYSWRECYFL